MTPDPNRPAGRGCVVAIAILLFIGGLMLLLVVQHAAMP